MKMKDKEKQSKALYILYIYISISRWITWCPENKLPRAIYKENYKTKYLKKNIQKCRSQISGSTKDHFAGENEVCEISQTHKKGCEITSQQKTDLAALRSGFQLAVLVFLRVTYIEKLQEKFRCTVQNGCEIISQQKGDFAAVQNSSFSLEWSASNGCNSFISTPNHIPFEALDCWLPELRNNI